jgi:hypothetical protein
MGGSNLKRYREMQETGANNQTLRGLKNERKTFKLCVRAYEVLLDDAYRQFRC